MSNPQRYSLALPDISYGMDEDSKGAYVLWKDYARLQAEVERLRKAGDAMAEAMWYGDAERSIWVKKFAETDWNAAKEGRPNE